MAERPNGQAKKRFQFTPAPLISLILLLIFTATYAITPNTIALGDEVAASSTALVSNDEKIDFGIENLFGIEFVLDGKTYTKTQLVYDFFKIAFSNTLWFEDMTNPGLHTYLNPSKQKMKSGNEWQKKWPWAYKFIDRAGQYPELGALNKWTDTITIGVGWPPHTCHGDPNVPPTTCPYDLDKESFDSPEVKKQLESMIADIKATTGLEARFISPSDETPDNFSKIRIVDTGMISYFNRFKAVRQMLDVHAYPPRGYGYFESALQGAVRFTPSAPAQVDGYFVSDSGNKIGLAVCQVWPHFQESLLNSLLTECVTRALGLPEMSVLNQNTILGHWNIAHDAHSRKVLFGSQMSPEDSAVANRGHKNPRFFEHELTDAAQMRNRMTQYDKAIVSILYCKKLKPGMSKNDVLKELYSSDDCFAAINRKKGV